MTAPQWNIICSTNMPFVLEAFGTLGVVKVLEGRNITASDVRDADILAIRSTTKVDRALLEGSRVKFVGTATIGTDHMDLAYLDQAGIRWCYAPGCNAESVSQYITNALLCLGQRNGFTLAGKTACVVGAGNVGSRVVRKLRALGLRVLMCDPPRARGINPPTGPGVVDPFEPGPFVSLDETLREADIVTLHAPLTEDGPDRSRHMADASFFVRLKKGAIFVNAARGGLVETDALLAAIQDGTVRHTVLDTWESEPKYRLDALAAADLATPHIAGHSFEGRVMGTVMLYRAACAFLGLEPGWSHKSLMPDPPVPEARANATGRTDETVLWEICRQTYDIEADDRRFREAADADATVRGANFDRLRKEYLMRREFACTHVAIRNCRKTLLDKVRKLGFDVSR